MKDIFIDILKLTSCQIKTLNFFLFQRAFSCNTFVATKIGTCFQLVFCLSKVLQVGDVVKPGWIHRTWKFGDFQVRWTSPFPTAGWCFRFQQLYRSGQIIATSHDLTPNGGLVREIPLFQGNLGWWNIIIWLDRCRDLLHISINPAATNWIRIRHFSINLLLQPCSFKKKHQSLASETLFSFLQF